MRAATNLPLAAQPAAFRTTSQCHSFTRLPAFPDEFGQMLYDNVSMQAWQMWLQESPRYINTYGVDLNSEQGRAFMEQQMRVFFGFEEGELAQTAWRPPEEGESG